MNQDIICTGPLSEFFRRLRSGRDRLFDYYQWEQPVPKGEVVRGLPLP